MHRRHRSTCHRYWRSPPAERRTSRARPRFGGPRPAASSGSRPASPEQPNPSSWCEDTILAPRLTGSRATGGRARGATSSMTRVSSQDDPKELLHGPLPRRLGRPHAPDARRRRARHPARTTRRPALPAAAAPSLARRAGGHRSWCARHPGGVGVAERQPGLRSSWAAQISEGGCLTELPLRYTERATCSITWSFGG
ncbi:MAG: hypothetical protein QOK16_3478 [Solirubrobacteraceae bacterium]|nr:hypothetical protein [Solirubrobacteraceae bacterium]